MTDVDPREVVADIITRFPDSFPEFFEEAAAEQAAAEDAAKRQEAEAEVAAAVERRDFASFLKAKRAATGARDNPGQHRNWLA